MLAEKHNRDLRAKLVHSTKQVKLLRQQLALSVKHAERLMLQNSQLNENNRELSKLSIISEEIRREYQMKYCSLVGTVEKLSNAAFAQSQRDELHQHQLHFFQHKFKQIYKAIEGIGTGKQAVDKLLMTVEELTEVCNAQKAEVCEMVDRTTQLTMERDAHRDESRELLNAKLSQMSQMSVVEKLNLQKHKRSEERIRQLIWEIDKLNKALSAADKQNKILTSDREKLKLRVSKLLARKGKDSGLKQCRNCMKEYNDKENYNWSCRTHRSEWSGEMWWCCGKKGKEAAGCKFGKHVHKDDNEEDKDTLLHETLGEEDRMRVLRNQRCLCCKEFGHRTDQCKRDPNLMTQGDMNEEQRRINKIKTFRKMHVDSSIKTAHFLKKSIMLPNERHKSESAKRQPTNPRHPFSRGIMTFDDYNYDQFNDHVLISQPLKEKRKVIVDSWKEVIDQVRPQFNEQD